MGEPAPPLTFLTPYWSGAEMMRIHLASIRRFHPSAPILVSKRGGGEREMEGYRAEFGIRYWIEDCSYMDAYLRLLERCESRFVCIVDHDAVLLANLDPYVDAIAAGTYDLVGIEECIRLPESVNPGAWPRSGGWLRFAPGCVASNFILFDWLAFRERWGLKGILGRRVPGALHYDFDYGIGQRLPRHHYLRPYHVPRYGIGNLLKDGDTRVMWHQWYGSYRTRLPLERDSGSASENYQIHALSEAGERALIDDYPDLEFSGETPAWMGPPPPTQLLREAERSRGIAGLMLRMQRAAMSGPREIARRAGRRIERWWRLR